jgi:hypothetical protein
MLDDLMELARVFMARGDLAHLALFLWAGAATLLLVFALRELALANRRFNDFVQIIAGFARKVEDA